MIHFHGGPITPETCAYRVWAGRHAFVSYAHPGQLELALSICQSVAFDNGAFPLWKSGKPTDWPGYYSWIADLLHYPAFAWAVIPDVIGGTEEENDELLAEWPHGPFFGVPVWHLNETPERLARLCRDYPRVALGSADEWDVRRPRKCLERLRQVWWAVDPKTRLHGLRMLNPAIFTKVPLSSGDSTMVARNIGIDKAWTGSYAPATKETRAAVLVERIEQYQAPEFLRAPTYQELAQGSLWEAS